VARGPLSDDLHTDAAAKERAVADERRRIRALRLRAEELRATADQFVVPSAQETLRRTAANYDRRANVAEAMLKGRPTAPGEKAG